METVVALGCAALSLAALWQFFRAAARRPRRIRPVQAWYAASLLALLPVTVLASGWFLFTLIAVVMVLSVGVFELVDRYVKRREAGQTSD